MTAAKTTSNKTAAPKRKTTAPLSPPAKAANAGSQTLEVVREQGKSQARQVADLVTKGEALNALNVLRYVTNDLGQLDITELAASLRESGGAVNGGDLSGAERMLNAQAVTLNVIFSELARRSHINMGEYLDASERYMRLALKAQSQCRATLETLAAIKNPPIVYARQMNVANGPQQVNNGTAQNNGKQEQPTARTPEAETQPNQLLEEAPHGCTQLDARATTQAGRGNPALAPVGAVNGAQER